MFLLQGFSPQGVFSSKGALPEVPVQPTFCHCIVVSSSGSHEAPCSPGDRCIPKTEIRVSVTFGCLYHVCIQTFKSVYHMCVPPFSHSGVRFLHFFLDIILSHERFAAQMYKLVVVSQLVRHSSAETVERYFNSWHAHMSIPSMHTCQLCYVAHVCSTLFSFRFLWGMAKISFLSSWISCITCVYQASEVCIACVSPKNKCVSRASGDTHYPQDWPRAARASGGCHPLRRI